MEDIAALRWQPWDNRGADMGRFFWNKEDRDFFFIIPSLRNGSLGSVKRKRRM